MGARISLAPYKPASRTGSRRCAGCGKFIAHREKAVHYFEPDSHFGPEVNEWLHLKCCN